MKSFYPVLIAVGKLFGIKANILENNRGVKPLKSFYDLTMEVNDGRKISFKEFRGKNVLLVNTASGCGYTNQLGDLDRLHQMYPALEVIGFPSNDFKEQEKLSDAEIANFCRVNYGVTFLLAKKSIVTKTSGQNEVFNWLSDGKKNGWNDMAPEWNFSKYLVNKDGVLISYFGPAIEPLSRKMSDSIKQ